MKRAVLLIVALAVLFGCAGDSGEYAEAPAEAAAPTIKLEVTEPEPLAVPEYQEPSSDEDWGTRCGWRRGSTGRTSSSRFPCA